MHTSARVLLSAMGLHDPREGACCPYIVRSIMVPNAKAGCQLAIMQTGELIEDHHEQRAKSGHHHRRFARHRRWSGQGVSGPQLSGRGDVPLDQPEQRSGHPGGPRRHRRSGDRRGADREAIVAIRADRHAGQQCRHLHRQAVHRLHARRTSRPRSRPTSPASSTSRSASRPRC